jgi:hypothetical protein
MRSPAFKEHAMETVYSSPILVMVFLGMAASVVIIQLIPALMTFSSMMKALFRPRSVQKLAP